jgi:hypothetical protein
MMTAVEVFTSDRLVFEFIMQVKQGLHTLNCSISLAASLSNFMCWTGYSPIQMNQGSNLFIPQRTLLYIFAVQQLIKIQASMSDYSDRAVQWVKVLNITTIALGGLATIPWLSPPLKG